MTIERIAQLPIEFGPVELIEAKIVYYPRGTLKKKAKKKKNAKSLKKEMGVWIFEHEFETVRGVLF